MTRRSRVHFPGALYHVICRGNQKQRIFLDERDFRTYLSYVSEYKAKYSFHLQFVSEGMDTGHEQKYYQVKDQRYLGGDEFVEKVEGLKKSHEPSYWEVPVANIAGEVIRGAGIPRDRLYSLTRDRQGAYGRNLVAYLARKVAGFRVKEIAQHFQREPMTISLRVKKVEKLLQQDRDFSRRIEIMEINLRGKSKKKYSITIA